MIDASSMCNLFHISSTDNLDLNMNMLKMA